MNKADLADRVFDKGLVDTRVQATRVVEAVFEEIQKAVVDGEKVSIAGFGIFLLKKVLGRQARNPRTGEMVDVPAHGRVKFTTALAFKNLVK